MLAGKPFIIWSGSCRMADLAAELDAFPTNSSQRLAPHGFRLRFRVYIRGVKGRNPRVQRYSLAFQGFPCGGFRALLGFVPVPGLFEGQLQGPFKSCPHSLLDTTKRLLIISCLPRLKSCRAFTFRRGTLFSINDTLIFIRTCERRSSMIKPAIVKASSVPNLGA